MSKVPAKKQTDSQYMAENKVLQFQSVVVVAC